MAQFTMEVLLEMEAEDLDLIVHELKSEEAAEINNRGKEHQIKFILDQEI